MANNKYVGNDGLLEFGVKFLEKLKTLFGWADGSQLMSAEDKSKLDNIAPNATAVTVDSTLSSTSTNPVQNKVINTALAGKVGSVATGSANGTISVDGTDVAVKGLGSAAYTNSNAYATAAQGTTAGTALQSLSKTDGTYVKLTVDKNGTAGSIAVNDTAIGTALDTKADASSVPTKTSELTNDAGFITEADIPEGAAASTTEPLMDGTAAVGTSNAFARGDHRHPSDTSKQDVITSTNKLSADLIADGTTNKAYTATEKTKLAGIATGAEVNVVKSVNTTAGTSGINLSNTNGALDVTISAGSVASGNTNFVTGGDVYTAINNAVGSVYKYKGTKATYSVLPTSDNVIGDVWNVEADFTIGSGTSAKLYPAGTNVAWTGSAWDPLGGITYNFMENTEVDTIVDNIFE